MAEIITTTFFIAFEDEYLIAAEPINNPLAKFNVTLTGTKDQIAGFICLFFAQYGGQGLGSKSMDDCRLLWDSNYHFNDDTEQITENNHRYIIYIESLVEFGVDFTTDNLSEFLSGMRAVSNFLPLKVSDEARLNENGEHIWTLYVDDPNWLQTAIYVDMTVDDQREQFLSEEDAYARANPLANFQPENVAPMIVKFVEL